MSIFGPDSLDLRDENHLGVVSSIDNDTAVLRLPDPILLRGLQVNRMVVLESSRAGEVLIGLIQKIIRAADEANDAIELGEFEPSRSSNLVRLMLMGTLRSRSGSLANVFVRSVDSLPEVGALVWSLEGAGLAMFMNTIGAATGAASRIHLGRYALDPDAPAHLDGDRFFQRHALIVGSTGSGKSTTVARIVEQASALPNANLILFDIHGEYAPLERTRGGPVRRLRIAGPSDVGLGIADGVLHLPFWLLGYEGVVAMFVDRSDQNAPNQAMVVTRTIRELKEERLLRDGRRDLANSFTVDSPIPFEVDQLVRRLIERNEERVVGASGRERDGEFTGRLSRLITRLQAKISDRRLSFLFGGSVSTSEMEWLTALATALVGGHMRQPGHAGGIKIIDFSEVPTDVLPLVVSVVASLVFELQQWQSDDERLPISLVADEAHLYMAERRENTVDQASGRIFEQIAKQGRKFGTSLVVVTQRPSDVNRTVLSQCSNVIAMRLTNAEDQTVIRKLLPDSLGSLAGALPLLDSGEAIVVGDAVLLPARVRIALPKNGPISTDMPVWKLWSDESRTQNFSKAVDAWRRQRRSAESRE